MSQELVPNAGIKVYLSIRAGKLPRITATTPAPSAAPARSPSASTRRSSEYSNRNYTVD